MDPGPIIEACVFGDSLSRFLAGSPKATVNQEGRSADVYSTRGWKPVVRLCDDQTILGGDVVYATVRVCWYRLTGRFSYLKPQFRREVGEAVEGG